MVPKMERGVSNIQYLQVLKDIEIWAIRKKEKLPQKHAWIVERGLIDNIFGALNHAVMANSIYVNKDESLLELRRNYLEQAHGELQAFVVQLPVIKSLCQNNEIKENDITTIGAKCLSGLSLIKGVIKSDKERFLKQ